jgi:2-oxoglutarate dehydrogenase E2 component (dihydrolipoamide succinyltransferase)
MADVVLPLLGETVEEAVITRWFKSEGEQVTEGEPLLEVSTDKVDTELPAPATGILAVILAPEDTAVSVGSVIARITDDARQDLSVPSEPSSAPEQQPSPASPRAQAAAESSPTPPSAAPAAAVLAAASTARSGRDPRVRSPLVRSMLARTGLDPASIPGSGDAGRITRRDVEQALVEGASTPRADASAVAPGERAVTKPVAATDTGASSHFEAFSTVRRRTAERMVLSATTIPQVTTVMEIDYEPVARVRAELAQDFKAREGFSLTYLPFIASAAIRAIQDFPHVNATVEGDGLRVHHSVHLGIAVDLQQKGLVVAVAREAQDQHLIALARRLNSMAAAARERRLGVDDITGSTFTITNPGGFGTLSGSPLINPPEVAILNVDGITRRPVVVDHDGSTAVAIHHVGNLCLTWDHRAIDGAYAAGYLRRIRELLQQTDWRSHM